MNERIKDFYDQVGLDFENFQRVTVTKGDMEKFAELIVKECANVDFRRKVGLTDYLGYEIGKVIKSHFGVEE
jgi:hypothetical protein